MGILMKNERNYTGVTGSGSTTPTNLNGLTDVNISSPTDGQALRYNNTSAQWENADNDLGGLSNVNISSPTNNQVLKYNSTSQKWENGAGGGGGSSYSTSEQVIGTWIDGKTLYQRTFTGTTDSSGDTTVGTIGSSSRVKSWNGAIQQTNTIDVPISVCLGGASNDYSYPYNDGGTIKLNCGSEMRSRPYWITVQYIK